MNGATVFHILVLLLVFISTISCKLDFDPQDHTQVLALYSKYCEQLGPSERPQNVFCREAGPSWQEEKPKKPIIQYKYPPGYESVRKNVIFIEPPVIQYKHEFSFTNSLPEPKTTVYVLPPAHSHAYNIEDKRNRPEFHVKPVVHYISEESGAKLDNTNYYVSNSKVETSGSGRKISRVNSPQMLKGSNTNQVLSSDSQVNNNNNNVHDAIETIGKSPKKMKRCRVRVVRRRLERMQKNFRDTYNHNVIGSVDSNIKQVVVSRPVVGREPKTTQNSKLQQRKAYDVIGSVGRNIRQMSVSREPTVQNTQFQRNNYNSIGKNVREMTINRESKVIQSPQLQINNNYNSIDRNIRQMAVNRESKAMQNSKLQKRTLGKEPSFEIVPAVFHGYYYFGPES